MRVAKRTACSEEPFALESGQKLPRLEIAYETYGALDANRSNAILLCHSYTSDHHAAGIYEREDERPGWWDALIGPGKLLDTERYCVVSSNCLGGAAGTTGPGSIDPATGRRYGMRFPVVTMRDMVNVQARLADTLEIERFHAVIGGCYGGFQALEWMVAHPRRVGAAIVVSATPRASVHTVALSHVMRAAICSDPHWNQGDYYEGKAPTSGIALFSMFGSLFWQDRNLLQNKLGPEMHEPREFRFDFAPEFEIERLLARLATPQNTVLDPNSLLYLARANDYFDLSRGRSSLADAFAEYRGDTLLVGFGQDWRYPPDEIAEIATALERAGAPVTHVTLDNPLGHGAFLRQPQCLEPTLSSFLARLEGREVARGATTTQPRSGRATSSPPRPGRSPDLSGSDC